MDSHDRIFTLPRWRRVVDGFASLSIIVACSAVTWTVVGPYVRGQARPGAAAARTPDAASPQPKSPGQRGGPPALPKQPLSLLGAATKGQPSAKVAIVEFADFQCPYCTRFAVDTLPRLEKEYVKTGQVLMAFRHFPLDPIHPFARKAAEAAECAGQEGKFWDMHDRLVSGGANLDIAFLRQAATQSGVNLLRFDKCVAGEQAAKVNADVEAAQQLGFGGTPSFAIGVVRADRRVDVKAILFGAQPFDAFRAEIEKLRGEPSATP